MNAKGEREREKERERGERERRREREGERERESFHFGLCFSDPITSAFHLHKSSLFGHEHFAFFEPVLYSNPISLYQPAALSMCSVYLGTEAQKEASLEGERTIKGERERERERENAAECCSPLREVISLGKHTRIECTHFTLTRVTARCVC